MKLTGVFTPAWLTRYIVGLSFRSADLKLIDFGSACKEDQTVYTYIQVEPCVSFGAMQLSFL
jgi:hypothetical protein